MRCAALATVLRQRGAEVAFICRELTGNYCDWLAGCGFPVLRLPMPTPDEAVDGRLAHAGWLGVTQQRDLRDTTDRLGQEEWDWIIVDHYGLDAEWEAPLRTGGRRLLAIDDLADRPHDVDVLLDQNLQNRPDRYRGLVSPECMQLIGPAFALLRPEFSDLHARKRDFAGGLKRVLISMGGLDPGNLTRVALEAIQESGLPVQVDVAMGANAPHLEAIKAKCAQMSDCELHIQTDRMAELASAADLAISTLGVSTWERCAVGLPALLVVAADNQKELALAAARCRVAIVLGHANDITATDIAHKLRRIYRKSAFLNAMSRRAAEITDGRGAKRVAAALLRNLTISIVSDADSWMNASMHDLVRLWSAEGHRVVWLHDVNDIVEGDIAFYLGCSQLASARILCRNVHNIVVHASDVPRGRGWSPLTWQIIAGKDRIVMSLFEAVPRVDSGAIYLQDELVFGGHELIDDLRRLEAASILMLCEKFVALYPEIAGQGRAQKGEASYYKRRRPSDSRLELDKTIAEQFPLFRVVDNDRYPAYFDKDGYRYFIRISAQPLDETGDR